MGLLDGTSQQNYYQGGDKGGYQFTSLEDIINQFLVAYVGEEKVISKVSRTDIAFHAQRAMQELSFDTFKSIKSQEIVLPPSNTMMLPHDYVNYTRVMWSDGAGIKHPLYPTRDTQNPFSIKQNTDGTYYFDQSSLDQLINGDFGQPLATGWIFTVASESGAWDSTTVVPKTGYSKYFFNYIDDKIELTAGILEFSQLWLNYQGNTTSKCYGCWQRIDVSNTEVMSLKADGTSGGQILDSSTILCDYGVLRVGITTTDPSIGWPHSYDVSIKDPTTGIITTTTYNVLLPATHTNPYHAKFPSPNFDASKLDLGYVEWNDGTTGEKELEDVGVSDYDEVWVWVQSYSPWTANGITAVLTGGPGQGGQTAISPTASTNNTHQVNSVDNISVFIPTTLPVLTSADADGNSTTWNNYKSHTPSDNVNKYDDGTYDLTIGERYGLDPQHAQTNGSFYIDNLRGLINFSSNVSGKTVILDYISDSLGTDGEMQVHKFAEEAMYKWIMCAVLSTKANIPEYVVRRYQKEKFAATRTAKLRLSNIKLEELTQILRGKSKWIKH
jgi:hypothetical protein